MLNWQTIVGKTILRVDSESAVNCVRLTFTDGTSVMVDTEHFGMNIYSPVLMAVDGYEEGDSKEKQFTIRDAPFQFTEKGMEEIRSWEGKLRLPYERS